MRGGCFFSFLFLHAGVDQVPADKRAIQARVAYTVCIPTPHQHVFIVWAPSLDKMFEFHLRARMYKKCQEASFIGSFVCRPPSVDKMFEFHLCARVYKKCQEASFIVSFVCHSHLYQYRCIPTPLYWPPQPTNPFRVNYKDASQLLVSALF